MGNIDSKTVEGFGDEWSRFDQSVLSSDLLRVFDDYFEIFPWRSLPANAAGFDVGCGSGRWARLVSPRVGTLHCIDPSEAALKVAQRNLIEQKNCCFHQASVDQIPLADDSMDFGLAIGVLHHIPDTLGGLRACVRKLKINAPLLVYIYYAFDNRPRWFRLLWRTSNLIRLGICKMPLPIRYASSQIIAAVVCYPLARLSWVLERLGRNVSAIPLSYYREATFYRIRTDALDRFGTRIEKRFTAEQVRNMMVQAGLHNIVLSEREPYWTAVGRKSAAPPDCG